ncbi:UxaA family hydrolase [Aneurinibacillus sp. Ricciae_BoGa-3]|uniref:UxaA family hydrolase n=1 Tax=Aneurinibacillus sp. Ricciae_BoGa-3 TaxID=3022697 RepID=UPI00234086B7|nr:UxaA family hydrolase [Aneurinibacillus sp. Ricciae_BoGa-3]WCK53234.1 UxaA family hydrolase [Aneurinibacillus sp. Ricciae_BoGa-3]
METIFRTVMMKPQDSVAVALQNIPAGSKLAVTCQDQVIQVELVDSIEFGHKFAVRPIHQGADILKYGEVIGVASADIKPGQHVHVHNLEGKRGRGDRVAN